MALYMNRIVLHLLLLLLVVICLGDICPQKCKCLKRKGKLRVDCRGKGLTEIFSQDQFPKNMQILDLSKNNISIIKKGFLEQHYNLERLFLQKNLIKVLEERAFVGLENLNRLNISKNQLVQLNKEAFIGLRKLDVLDLSHNRIRTIDIFAFRGLESLTKLVLKNNSFTTISNGTFDELSTLRKIDLKSVPLNCDCHLNSFVRYLGKKGDLRVPGRCRISREKIASLKGTNLCEKPPEIFINPSEDQIVSVGDSFEITCQTAPKAKRPVKLYWTKNQNSLPKHVQVVSRLLDLDKKFVTYVKFGSIRWQDGGKYKCYGSRLIAKEITVRVITSKDHMCPRNLMKLRHDEFLWPVTLERTTAIVPCPWPNNHDQGLDTNIRRTCTEKGVWGQENVGNCQLVSLSKKLILLNNLLKKNDFVDITRIAENLKLITSSSSLQTAENITLVFDVFAGIIVKRNSYNIPFKGQLLDDMLASFNNMMNVNDETLYAAERRDQSPSRIGAHLELISRRIVNETSTRVLSNMVIGSVDLTKIRSNEYKTCNVFFGSGIRLQAGGVSCEPYTRKNHSVSIQIPSTIFRSLQAAGHSIDSPRLQFLVYRNAKLFPNVISNMTGDNMGGRNVSSSVLSIQMANIEELNLTDPLVIRFATQPGTEPVVTYFVFGREGRQWSRNTDCVVKDSTASMATVECQRLVNKNLAIMSHLGITNVVVYPVEIVVYLGAVVTSLLLIATLITFALARDLRFNRDDIIMLMNACLALFVVLLSFAFGIDRTERAIVCRAMGMSLHFFFFASLLWLGSYVVCVTRRLMPPKETEEVFNPVLMYYMVSWGVPAIICGMTVAGDIKYYKSTDYCWLTESAGLGAFVGPACLLFIINAVLLVRLHLLLARGIIDPRPSAENTEEERLQTDEPGVLEEVLDPSEAPNAEKSAITLNLVATWVVMSLIYLNFILAYFLVNSRTSKLRWIFLSYVYALANVALGAAIFGFHCVARPEVREAWRVGWKVFRAWKTSCGLWRTLWITRRKNDTLPNNGIILLNGEDITHRIESDRQSNITLPSSAALTNDVFVNGRPMSTARVSLLDEADFPPEESPRGGPVDNEVDITETGNSEENQRSQSSIHSERKNRACEESILEESEENARLLVIPDETHDDNAEITDGVTSKSESSAPTAIEVTEPQTPARADSPTVEYPHNVPHAGMVRPFMGNGMRQFPPSHQVGHPNLAPSAHQFRPVFQAPFAHQAMPAHHIPPVHQGPPAHQVPPVNQVPSTLEPPPPSYQRALELMASQSSSSVGDNSALSRFNSKRKRSNESLGSRNESGSVGPRARKLAQLQSQASSSSAISEVPAPGLVPSWPSETTNARSAALAALGASSSNPRPANRYRDGRAKPEPKQWNGTTQSRIAYVPIPHVSKIHREPLHNETSV